MVCNSPAVAPNYSWQMWITFSWPDGILLENTKGNQMVKVEWISHLTYLWFVECIIPQVLLFLIVLYKAQ